VGEGREVRSDALRAARPSGGVQSSSREGNATCLFSDVYNCGRRQRSKVWLPQSCSPFRRSLVIIKRRYRYLPFTFHWYLQLWEKVEKSGLFPSELLALQEEFSHHQEKVTIPALYFSMIFTGTPAFSGTGIYRFWHWLTVIFTSLIGSPPKNVWI
jgi:Alpha-2-macroglobulin RAP, C-terminal domain